MKVIITIDCENAAFEESPRFEVSRILTEVADRIASLDFNEPFDRNLTLRDHNGNKVGTMEVREKNNHAMRVL